MNERREDWSRGVDENLASLNTGQRVTDKQLDDLELKYEILDSFFRGDPEKDTDGLIARFHNLENAVQELRAERVKFKVADEAARGIKWQSWTAIIVAILGLLGGILPNLRRIKESFQSQVHYQPDPKLKKEIEEDKRRHRKI